MRPRPALLFTLAYGAGLATGLLRFGNPIGVLLLLLAVITSGRLIAYAVEARGAVA